MRKQVIVDPSCGQVASSRRSVSLAALLPCFFARRFWRMQLSAAKRLGITLHQIEAALEVSKLQNGGFCDGFEQQTLSRIILTKAMAHRDI